MVKIHEISDPNSCLNRVDVSPSTGEPMKGKERRENNARITRLWRGEGDPALPCLKTLSAKSHEIIFVLLARDAAAAATVRYWIDERIRLEKNKRGDEQIQIAEALADTMDAQFKHGIGK